MHPFSTAAAGPLPRRPEKPANPLPQSNNVTRTSAVAERETKSNCAVEVLSKEHPKLAHPRINTCIHFQSKLASAMGANRMFWAQHVDWVLHLSCKTRHTFAYNIHMFCAICKFMQVSVNFCEWYGGWMDACCCCF